MRLEHVAVWVADLERMRAFYVDVLGGHAGQRYHNTTTGFSSYFISFGEGSRIELMQRPGVGGNGNGVRLGYSHVALSLGSREAVDNHTAALRGRGVPVDSEPRLTGDGYYEAVILDPEGNRIELVASHNEELDRS